MNLLTWFYLFGDMPEQIHSYAQKCMLKYFHAMTLYEPCTDRQQTEDLGISDRTFCHSGISYLMVIKQILRMSVLWCPMYPALA